ncbi:hypothetical protein [Streptomyces sp. NPDC029526]|uniref:hypothetical protein n=1 Tax=Streptomyces sp. NPDC029526 TaxID=3155728 RepID=UPI0033F3A169
MSDHRLEGPGENGVGVPRDLPDQQAGAGEDPWEVAPGAAQQAADDERTGSEREAGEENARTHSADDSGSEAAAGADDDAPAEGTGADTEADTASGTGTGTGADDDVPDTDEAGTGRRGAPHTGSPNPDHPVPEESPG